MVISHKHRYLFIEVPHTASWAIRHELCTYYDGKAILHKHATYPEFLRTASQLERKYVVIAGVRNPMDCVVSHYYKSKSGHFGTFASEEQVQSGALEPIHQRKYHFVRENNAGFADYFRRFHRRPYSSMIDISAEHIDVLIRYEQLQEDFAKVLQRLNLKQVRPLPVINKTLKPKIPWESHYDDQLIDEAKRVFGPFAKRWKYPFPAHWGPYSHSRSTEWEYALTNFARHFYMTRIRYSPHPFARYLRELRSHMP